MSGSPVLLKRNTIMTPDKPDKWGDPEKKKLKALVHAELTCCYWEFGEEILALGKHLQLAHRELFRFVKEQGFNYVQVKKAMRIRQRYGTAESCQGMTVEEALACGKVRIPPSVSGADE
jgi:hypothetical protein